MFIVKNNSTIVCSFGAKSNWTSVKLIQSSLLKCYRAVLGSKQVIEKAEHNLVDTRVNVRRLVVISGTPHPIVWLANTIEKLPNLQEVFFHIAGDFIFYAPEWRSSLKLLSNYKVKFIVGSEFQKNVIASLLKSGADGIEVIPFGIGVPDSVRKRINRKKVRLELSRKVGFSSADYLFVISGRNSFEKNIFLVIEALQRLQNYSWQLIVLGTFDDFNPIDKFPGLLLGEFQATFGEWLELAPEQLQSKVHLLDHVSHQKALEIMSACDCCINLSTFIGEDFGASIAEALSLGTPVIMTRWGLASTIEQDYNNNDIIPVYKVGLNVKIGMRKLVRAMSLKLKREKSEQYRSELALIADKYFSEASQKVRIKRLMSSPALYCSLNITPEMNDLVKSVLKFRHGYSSLFGQVGKRGSLHTRMFKKNLSRIK